MTCRAPLKRKGLFSIWQLYLSLWFDVDDEKSGWEAACYVAERYKKEKGKQVLQVRGFSGPAELTDQSMSFMSCQI